MSNLHNYKYLLKQLNCELNKEEIQFVVIYNIKRLLIQTSKRDISSDIKIYDVVNASFKTLKTETLILLNQVLIKIKEAEENMISEWKKKTKYFNYNFKFLFV